MIVARGVPGGIWRRAPAWLLVLSIGLLGLVAGPGPSPAHAQTHPAAGHDHAGHDHGGHDHAGHDHAGHDHAGHDHAGHDHAGHDHAGHAQAAQVAHTAASADAPATLTESSPGAALFFWLFALMIVAGSIFVITRRNLISAVMGMVATFFAIAAVYTMLYAHFLAAIQVLVYAGAIMVLFVFVIMILNKPEAEPWSHWSRVGIVGNVAAVGVIGYLMWRLGQVLWNVPVEPGMVAPPADIAIAHIDEPAGFGSTLAIGDSLFREYLFPFEAVSLVLLIAVVGALAVARPHERRPAATTSDDSSSA